MLRTITVTEAARGFADLINRVFYKNESALLMRGGKPVAKISPVKRALTGKELAAIWASGPHLSPEEAEAFERDLKEARDSLPPLVDKWDLY